MLAPSILSPGSINVDIEIRVELSHVRVTDEARRAGLHRERVAPL